MRREGLPFNESPEARDGRSEEEIISTELLTAIDKVGETATRLEDADVTQLDDEEKGKVRGCKSRLSRIFYKFGKILSALSLAGILSAASIDQITHRDKIETTTNSAGDKEYKHSDPKTTHILNYLGGRESLTEEETLEYIKETMKEKMRFHNIAVPTDFDDFTLDQLDEFLATNKEYGLPRGEIKKFAKEGIKKSCPDDAGVYSELWQLAIEGGAPKIRLNNTYLPFNPSRERMRDHFNGVTNTISLNAPYETCEFDSLIAEMAHGVQQSSDTTARYVNFLRYLKDLSGVVLKGGISPQDLGDAYQNTYTTEGTIEFETHEVIEPALKKKYERLAARTKEKPILLAGDLPNETDNIPR